MSLYYPEEETNEDIVIVNDKDTTVGELCLIIIVTCLSFAIMFAFAAFINRSVEVRTEENCVEFYDKHNYITNECEIYRDKLEK